MVIHIPSGFHELHQMRLVCHWINKKNTEWVTLSCHTDFGIICLILNNFISPSPPTPTHQIFKHTMTSPICSSSLRCLAMTSASAPRWGVSLFPMNQITYLFLPVSDPSTVTLSWTSTQALHREAGQSERGWGGAARRWGDTGGRRRVRRSEG